MIEAETVLQDRYRVRKQIGQGGMGAVYMATDERFGSTVTIKETLFAEANFGKAFEREARLLNNLRHPALPRVSDHFSDKNGQFIVMEVVKNGVVVVNPDSNIQLRPIPPDVRMPMITTEQLKNLSPAQRRRIRQIIEAQRKQMENSRPPFPTKEP